MRKQHNPAPVVPSRLKRRVWFGGFAPVRGWTLRRYVVLPPGMELDTDLYRPGVLQALAMLPEPARTDRRPGDGFVILHPGVNRAYLVMNWWDNVNELFQRVLIAGEDRVWHDARGGASFCIWDAQIIMQERDRFVGKMLATGGDGDPDLPDQGWTPEWDSSATGLLDPMDHDPGLARCWPTE